MTLLFPFQAKLEFFYASVIISALWAVLITLGSREIVNLSFFSQSTLKSGPIYRPPPRARDMCSAVYDLSCFTESMPLTDAHSVHVSQQFGSIMSSRAGVGQKKH